MNVACVDPEGHKISNKYSKKETLKKKKTYWGGANKRCGISY